MSGETCQPGDIVVRAIARGFLVCRVMKANGHATEWQYIGTALERPVAVALARTLAREANVHAWFEGQNNSYEPISLK